MSPSPWQTSLRQLLEQPTLQHSNPPRIAVLGVGNTFRSDDAAGVLAARRLADSPLTQELDFLLVVDAGHAPENTTAELRRFKPEVILLIDAAEMGEEPGTIRWLGIDQVDGMSASTHTLPLSMFAKYVTLELGCEVKILGIQPQSTEIGEMVSDPVLQAVDGILNEILDSLQARTALGPESLN